MYFDITLIFDIIIFIISVFIVLLGLSNWIAAPPKSKPPKDTTFHPDIHYKRCSEGGTEYLRTICPEDSAAAKDRFQILLDFSDGGDDYFLFKDDNKKFYLRKYITRSASDGITRYILQDVTDRAMFNFFKKDSCLDYSCRTKLGCSMRDLLPISYKDQWMENIWINTYSVTYHSLFIDPIDAAFQMEKRSMESICAEDDSVDFDSELDDFDPDVDEVPDGYFVNEFGELELGDDPNQDPHNVGSDAWKAQQQKFTNDSLYIYHDWDIFKDEK